MEKLAFPVLRALSAQRDLVAKFPSRIFLDVAANVAGREDTSLKNIRNLFMRRLDLGGAAAFYAALSDWAEGRPQRLAAALKSHAPADLRDRIDRVLALPTERESESPLPVLRDTAAAPPVSAPPDDHVVVLRNLDPDTLFVLRNMARQSERTLEAEIRDLIDYAFRAKREEFIRWTDALRASHTGLTDNLSVADIREDRDNR